MKTKLLGLVLSGTLIVTSTSVKADSFTGDKLYSCEAILCLAGGQFDGECRRSIKKYFNIFDWNLKKMIKKRLDFLNICPTGGGGSEAIPSSDIRLIAEVADKCSTESFSSYASGIGSSAESVNDRRIPCTWSAGSGKWVSNGSNYFAVCDQPRGSFNQRVRQTKNMCQPLWDKFEVDNEGNPVTKKYITVTSCSIVLDSSQDGGATKTVCNERLYDSKDPSIPQAQPMPQTCNSYTPPVNCTSVNVSQPI